MKLAFKIILIATVLAFILFYFTLEEPSDQAVQMPWHVTIHNENNSEVFGVMLNQMTLEEARQKFGQLEGIALFQNKDGRFNLEAYFGKVSIGPFAARLIVTLNAPQSALEALQDHSVKRVKTDDGSTRWTLTAQKQVEQGLRTIKTLTYIPSYGGMDAEYLKQRFGSPATQERIDETTELWSYPHLGVRIMLDNDGKEMFEYTSLADFPTLSGE
ncbi:MAG: hypothetical protein QNJ56_05140 [Gammaproteobacteria bacterium]|nr:hypothetical protein [Gammaproteobacteria bacterium]